MIVDITIPIRTWSTTNQRGSWGKTHRRSKKQRQAVRLSLGVQVSPTSAPLIVTMTRIAPRALDEADNLPSALKSVRDEVAACFGRDDGPKAGIEWRYDQERGEPREYAVRILVERAS